MAWRSTQQNAFAGALLVQHKPPAELDDVHNINNRDETEQTHLSFIHPPDALSYPPLIRRENTQAKATLNK